MFGACVGGAAGQTPARRSLPPQLAEFCRIDAERAEKRLALAEKRALEEEIYLARAAGGEAVRLSCQCDNISRFFKVKNRGYYNKTAVALETNVKNWCAQLKDRYGDLPAHLAEFTITIPHIPDEDLATARRRFTRAFNEFNRRFLKERARDCFGDFVRVFEPHKDGVLHCHILIECKKSLRRGDMAFEWRSYKGASFVKGETVADWVCDVWAAFRSEELAKYGIGKIHTLQPIRKGALEFSRYIAKYVCKNLSARPEYMKGLRVVAYSRGFLDGARLMVYGYDKADEVEYWSKKHQRFLKRPRRFSTFDINCPSNRARGAKLLQLVKFLGVPLHIIKQELGAHWYFYIRPYVQAWRVAPEKFRKMSKFEKFAALRSLFGNPWQSVLRFANSPYFYRFEDFKKVPTQTKINRGFSVCGFIQNGVFIGAKRAYRAAFSVAMNGAQKLRNALQNRAEYAEKRQDFYKRRSAAYGRFCRNEITVSEWHDYLTRWQSDFADFCSGVKKWLPKINFKDEIRKTIQLEMAI